MIPLELSQEEIDALHYMATIGLNRMLEWSGTESIFIGNMKRLLEKLPVSPFTIEETLSPIEKYSRIKEN